MTKTESEARPPIPADIKRRVLVEAGHRCAIPTCRHIEVEVHHIIPWAKCKKHEYDNLIALCPNCHNRADQGHIDQKSLRLYKFNLRFAHDKFSQLEIDVLFEANLCQPGQSMDWPPFMRILIKRILDAKFVEIPERQNGGVFVNKMRIDPDRLFITDKGREFIQDIGSREM